MLRILIALGPAVPFCQDMFSAHVKRRVVLRPLHTSSGALFHLIQCLLRIAFAELDARAPRCPRQHVRHPAPKSILQRS
jgi:hypothetical protein